VNKKINFAVQDFNIVEEDVDSQFATVEIEAFSSGENRHDLTCPVEVLKATAPTIYEKPIVFEVNRIVNDFGSHVDNENERRIAGFIVPDSAEFFERPDGRTGLKVVGKIWKYYAQWALDVFKSAANMVKKVSVEILMADPDGNVMTDFEYTGVSLLGDLITEGSPGAHAKLLSFSTGEYTKAYNAEFAKYSNTDFSIPDNVKKNCQDGLNIYEEFGVGGTSVSLAMARYIVKNNTATPQKIRKMSKYFAVKGGRVIPDDIESKEYVSWQLYGGHHGQAWSEKLVDEMDVIDEQLVTYFEEKILLSDNPEEKEMDMDEKEKGVFEEKDDPKKDEDVTMESDKESPTPDETMAEGDEEDEKEEMAKPEEDEEKDMADDSEDEDVDMGCDEKKYETLFAEASEKLEVLEAENVTLREFKANVEKEQFELRVGSILNEVNKVFSEDELAELREDAIENYSLETITGWSNVVKAKAFELSKDLPEVEEKDDGILRMANVDTEEKKEKSSPFVW